MPPRKTTSCWTTEKIRALVDNRRQDRAVGKIGTPEI
jgi:hypothetical protein